MIATWYVEAGKYDVLPVDSSRHAALCRRAPEDRGRPDVVKRLSEHPGRAGQRRCQRYSTGRTALPPTLRFPRAAQKACCFPRAATTAAIRCTFRTASSAMPITTSGGTLYYVESTETVPAGRHQLRFEFEVTGKPDIAHGKGAPGKRPALHRRQAGRTGRHPADQSAHHWIAQRHHLRRRRGRAGDAEVQAAVPVHRHDSQSDRGRERRADQGRRGRRCACIWRGSKDTRDECRVTE